MVRLALLLLFLGCAAVPTVRDCPYLTDCQEKCHQTGFIGAVVVEDEENYQCFCTRPVKVVDPT